MENATTHSTRQAWRVFMTEDPGVSMWEARAARKRAVRVRRGLYVDSVTDEWERYRLQSGAVLAALAPTAFLAGPTAAVMRDLPMVGEPPAKVFVRGVPRGRYGQDVKVINGAQAAFDAHEGLRLASPAWMVADCARVMSRRDALIVADAAVRESMCRSLDIAEVATQLTGCTGVDGVRWVARHCDAGAESPGESWLRMVVTGLGYEVQSQVTVGRSRVDLLITGTRVILEFDGAVKYQPGSWQGSQSMLNEKRRQAELEAAGYIVLRVIWDQLSDPVRLDRRIRAALGALGNP